MNAVKTPLSKHAAIAERFVSNVVQAGSPALSPDGSMVAFVVQRVDMAKNGYRTQVWLGPTDGSRAPAPVSSGDHDGQPEWSPDGNSLAFTSRRGEKKGESTLHVMPVGTTGEVRNIATRKDGLGDLRWSPDGRWVAFTSRTPDERYDADDESWQAPRKVETFFTQRNGEGWTFDRPTHIYVVAADGTGSPRNLTPGPHQAGTFAWLQDSSGVITSASRHEGWDLDLATDLYLVPLEGEIRGLTAQTGGYNAPAPSPDGHTIAFLGHDDSLLAPQNVHVGLVPVEGGAHRWISRDLDRTFEPTAGVQAPIWLDDSTLLASAEDRGETHLYSVSTSGGAPKRLTSGPITVKSFDAAGGTIVFCAGAVDEVSDVFVVTGDTTTRLTDFARRYRTAASPLTWERFAAPCTDGTGEIDAWIMRPEGFDPDVRYPVLLDVHGGPHTQYGESMFDEAQMQAAAGFVVLMSNPRGGSGREESWGQAIVGPKHPRANGTGWGSVDVDDLLAVVDTALARYSFCDPDRIGMIGGSYGGYIATWLAGNYSDRFKAICSERAVNNMITEEFTSDISTFFRAEMGADHLTDPDEYVRMSPIRFADKIDVPMLLIHSENDLRCPVNQAEELFVALRTRGKDVTFYRFPGEDHELSRSGSPIHRRQRGEIILDFFAEHLGAN